MGESGPEDNHRHVALFFPNSLWCHVVAGGIAGGLSRTCTAPLDRLKLFLQVYGGPKIGLFKCATLMYEHGGFFGMWRGNGISVLKIIPEFSSKFSVYEYMKRILPKDEHGNLTMAERFIAGCVAGGVSQTVIYPLEVMKVRLAVLSGSHFKSARQLAALMYSQGGLGSFYRGYRVNLMGVIPYAGLDLAVYETLRNKFSHQSTPTASTLMLCAISSAACGQAYTYPLSLIRTQMQAQDTTQRPLTMPTLFRQIIDNQGILGLYRGLIPNFAKVVPVVCISYVTFERTRALLNCSTS